MSLTFLDQFDNHGSLSLSSISYSSVKLFVLPRKPWFYHVLSNPSLSFWHQSPTSALHPMTSSARGTTQSRSAEVGVCQKRENILPPKLHGEENPNITLSSSQRSGSLMIFSTHPQRVQNPSLHRSRVYIFNSSHKFANLDGFNCKVGLEAQICACRY